MNSRVEHAASCALAAVFFAAVFAASLWTAQVPDPDPDPWSSDLDLAEPPPLAGPAKPRPHASSVRRPAVAKHVVVVSVDGLRPDAIVEAQAPAFLALMKQGAYATSAETIRPSVTLPSHTAMLSGLDFKRHGVVWNNYRPGHIGHPTVFSVATDSGLSAAMFFAKDKFHYLADPESVAFVYGPNVPRVVPRKEDVTRPDFKENTDPELAPRPPPGKDPRPRPSTSAAGLAKQFREQWPRHRWPLTFVHFGEPDGAGHGKGWMSKPYFEAVLKVDVALADLVAVLRESGAWEQTALIVTADHGGAGRQHYTRSKPDLAENVLIPWICVGPGVAPGTVIERPLRTMDTAPTALAFLGLEMPHDIDGEPVTEVLLIK